MTNRFTESQIVAFLKEAEAGVTVPELCRRHGIGQSTFYLCPVGISGDLNMAEWKPLMFEGSKSWKRKIDGSNKCMQS